MREADLNHSCTELKGTKSKLNILNSCTKSEVKLNQSCLESMLDLVCFCTEVRGIRPLLYGFQMWT